MIRKNLPWKVIAKLEWFRKHGKEELTYYELKKKTGLHMSNLNRAINQLEDEGYVELDLIDKNKIPQSRTTSCLMGRKHITLIKYVNPYSESDGKG